MKWCKASWERQAIMQLPKHRRRKKKKKKPTSIVPTIADQPRIGPAAIIFELKQWMAWVEQAE